MIADIDKFRERLLQAEKASGLYENKFAEKIGLQLTSYRNFKAGGTQGPSLAALIKMINKFGIERVIYFLTGAVPTFEGAELPPLAEIGQATISLPKGKPEPLSDNEQVLLEKALGILRSEGVEGDPDAALARTIDALYPSVRNKLGRPAALGESERPVQKGQGGAKE